MNETTRPSFLIESRHSCCGVFCSVRHGGESSGGKSLRRVIDTINSVNLYTYWRLWSLHHRQLFHGHWWRTTSCRSYTDGWRCSIDARTGQTWKGSRRVRRPASALFIERCPATCWRQTTLNDVVERRRRRRPSARCRLSYSPAVPYRRTVESPTDHTRRQPAYTSVLPLGEALRRPSVSTG